MNHDYQSLLIAMMQEDQKLISVNDADAKKFQNQNKRHIKQLKNILLDIKEPRISILGKDGALAAWLLVQHASYDKNFQKTYLRLTKSLYKKDPKDVYVEGIAYLEDRILCGEHNRQRYGTQFKESQAHKGSLEPYTIIDPKNLDKRRLSMGLPAMQEYVVELEKVYGKKVIYSQ